MEYYGSPVNLKTIAQISTPDASSLLVQPYDKSRYQIELNSVENLGIQGRTANHSAYLCIYMVGSKG